MFGRLCAVWVPALVPVSAWLAELLGGFCSVAGGALVAADELLVWVWSVAGGSAAASLVLGVVFAVAVLFEVLGSGSALAVSRELVADCGALLPVLFCPPLGEVVTAGPVSPVPVVVDWFSEMFVFAVLSPVLAAGWFAFISLLGAVEALAEPAGVETLPDAAGGLVLAGAPAWLVSIPADELVGLPLFGAMLVEAEAPTPEPWADIPLDDGAACEVVALQVFATSVTLLAAMVCCSPVLAPLGAVLVAELVVFTPPVSLPVISTVWPTSCPSWLLSPVTM